MAIDARAIALFSSSRRDGNTGQFIDLIAGELGIEVIELEKLHLSTYDYEHRNRNDDLEPLMKRLLQFDQIIFASPVYWYSVPAAMKMFLDRLSDYLDLPDLLPEGRRLRGKRAYIVCTSICTEAPASFINTFVDTFAYLGMHYGGVAHLDCSDGYSQAKGRAEGADLLKKIQQVPESTAKVPVADLEQQLATLDPRLNAGAYVYVTLAEVRNIDASAIVATMREPEGTSYVIEAGAAAAARLPPSPLFAWITLSVQSDLQSVGLTAAFSRALAAAQIGCNVIAGARHDHIFVPAAQADRAMTELRALQAPDAR
jgi:multimeric flavodoxin WrbA